MDQTPASAMEAATASSDVKAGGQLRPPAYTTFYFRLHDRALRVRTQDPWARELLSSTYAPMRSAPDDDAEDVVISPAGDFAGAFYVLRDLFAAFASGVRDCVALYAACVAIEGKAILLLGAPTIGKSVLALNLIRHGARFLGDEITLLNLRDGTVCAVPRTAALREPGLPYLLDAGLRVRINSCERALFTPRGRLWYALNAATLGTPYDARRYPLGGIFILAERGAQAAATVMPETSALSALTRRMHRLPQTLEHVAILHKLARNVQTCELVVGGPQETAETVMGRVPQCV